MLLHQITINTLLFLIGIIGIVVNYSRVFMTLIAIELLLLSSSLNFILCSYYLNDLNGQLFSIFILTVAAAESSIGLAILVVYYKLKGDINVGLLEKKG